MEAVADAQADVFPIDETTTLAYHLAFLPSTLTAAALLQLPAPWEMLFIYMFPF